MTAGAAVQGITMPPTTSLRECGVGLLQSSNTCFFITSPPIKTWSLQTGRKMKAGRKSGHLLSCVCLEDLKGVWLSISYRSLMASRSLSGLLFFFFYFGFFVNKIFFKYSKLTVFFYVDQAWLQNMVHLSRPVRKEPKM